MACRILETSQNIRMRLVDYTPNFSEEVRHEINRIRQRAEQEGKFNGEILSYASHTASSDNTVTIDCYIGEYKQFLAQVQNPDLGVLISPLAVSGVMCDKKGRYLVGERSERVTQYPKHFEFAPSGGISSCDVRGRVVDHYQAILREFCEETVFEKSAVSSLNGLGLIVNEEHSVYDIVYLIRLNREFTKTKNLKEEYCAERIMDFEGVLELSETGLISPSLPVIVEYLRREPKE